MSVIQCSWMHIKWNLALKSKIWNGEVEVIIKIKKADLLVSLTRISLICNLIKPYA